MLTPIFTHSVVLSFLKASAFLWHYFLSMSRASLSCSLRVDPLPMNTVAFLPSDDAFRSPVRRWSRWILASGSIIFFQPLKDVLTFCPGFVLVALLGFLMAPCKYHCLSQWWEGSGNTGLLSLLSCCSGGLGCQCPGFGAGALLVLTLWQTRPATPPRWTSPMLLLGFHWAWWEWVPEGSADTGGVQG